MGLFNRLIFCIRISKNKEILEQKIFSRDFALAFLAPFAFSSSFFILIPTLPISLIFSLFRNETGEGGRVLTFFPDMLRMFKQSEPERMTAERRQIRFFYFGFFSFGNRSALLCW